MKKINQIIPLVIIVCCVAIKAQAQFGDLLKKLAPHVDININLNGSVTNKNEVGGDNANVSTEKSGVVAQTQPEANAGAEVKVQPNKYQDTPLEVQFLKYKSKAENGDPEAQYNLGKCYAKGLGVAQDGAEAVKWFRKSAEQGNADGQYNLGICYANGQGIDKNYVEAAKWFRKAAEQGHLKAKEQEAEVKELVQAEAREQAEAKQQADAEEAFAKQKAQKDARESLLDKFVLAACGVLLFTPISLTYLSLRKK
jgi:TPR repeat protein